jgi:hypothetical protein
MVMAAKIYEGSTAEIGSEGNSTSTSLQFYKALTLHPVAKLGVLYGLGRPMTSQVMRSDVAVG